TPSPCKLWKISETFSVALTESMGSGVLAQIIGSCGFSGSSKRGSGPPRGPLSERRPQPPLPVRDARLQPWVSGAQPLAVQRPPTTSRHTTVNAANRPALLFLSGLPCSAVRPPVFAQAPGVAGPSAGLGVCRANCPVPSATLARPTAGRSALASSGPEFVAQ